MAGNLCYKLDFTADTLAETLRQAQKWEVELEWEASTCRGLAHSLSEVMLLHQLHSPAKDPRQGNPCSGANKTAVLTKISSEDC